MQPDSYGNQMASNLSFKVQPYLVFNVAIPLSIYQYLNYSQGCIISISQYWTLARFEPRVLHLQSPPLTFELSAIDSSLN